MEPDLIWNVCFKWVTDEQVKKIKTGFVLNEIGPEVMEKSELLFCFCHFTHRKRKTSSFTLNQFLSEFFSSVKSYVFPVAPHCWVWRQRHWSLSVYPQAWSSAFCCWSEIFYLLRSYFFLLLCCSQVVLILFFFFFCLCQIRLLIVSEWNGSLSVPYQSIFCLQ